MKKIILIITAFVFVISCKNEPVVDYAIVSGIGTNLEASEIYIASMDRKVNKAIEVAEDGSFLDTLRVEDGKRVMFEGRADIYFFISISKGNDIKIHFDAKDFNSTVKFSGVGSENSTYLHMRSMEEDAVVGINGEVYMLEEAQFKAKMKALGTSLTNLLSTVEGVSDDFKAIEKKDIHFSYLQRLLGYQFSHGRAVNDSEFKVSDEFLNEMKDFDYDNQSDYDIYETYRRMVQNHFFDLAIEKAKSDSIDLAIAQLEVATTFESKGIREGFIFSTATNFITRVKDIKPFYDKFLSLSKNEENNAEVKKQYDRIMKLSKGQPSPVFVNYENHAGGTTSLVDLKGKYVYIDLWATWCGPCLDEIPSLKKVEKAYHGKNIHFVSISIDVPAAHDKWAAMVNDKELGGIQLFANKDAEVNFQEEYIVKGIPRFILIGPEGNIVDSNAPRPSDSKLIALFNELNI